MGLLLFAPRPCLSGLLPHAQGPVQGVEVHSTSFLDQCSLSPFLFRMVTSHWCPLPENTLPEPSEILTLWGSETTVSEKQKKTMALSPSTQYFAYTITVVSAPRLPSPAVLGGVT